MPSAASRSSIQDAYCFTISAWELQRLDTVHAYEKHQKKSSSLQILHKDLKNGFLMIILQFIIKII